MKNNKIILVTGAAGFIGFHTSLTLKKRGDCVIGLDNFNSYYSIELKRERSRALNEAGIEVIDGDLNDPGRLKALFEKYRFSHVLHLAAQAGVRYARENPGSYISSNIDGFLSLLEVLRIFPQTKLVYASSSSVYGRNEKIPFSVSDCTDKPANLYAATKKANELMAYSYHHLYGIAMTGLRYFTVYGPWGRPDMAYFSFTKAILEKKPITLFNNGNMSRDFTYIDDIVKGTIAAIDLEADFEIFNLGNHRPESLLHFVSLLENALGMEAKKILEGPSPGEVEMTFADIEHSQKYLSYSPQISLKEGIERFVTWYCSYFSV